MSLSEELTKRGFIYQFSADTLAEIIDGEPRIIYHGIDPSADSAHVGNLVVWFLLRHLALGGHKIIFLVGGGTGMIGDPKPDAERELKPEVEIDANVAALKAQAEVVVGQNVTNIDFVNNKDWLTKIGLIEFLRDIGKHFTVNELIKKDAIAKRVASDTGISYTEFAYPLLQGYDYLVLNREYGCAVQVGGSDQWGNIIAGVDLIRRKEQKTAYAVTVPLIVDKATGKKFGKSEGNAVWLDPKKTSPYAFYQFWLNVSDDSVSDYLKLYTFLPLDTVDDVITRHTNAPQERLAQRTLAENITTIIHGSDVTKAVLRVSDVLFGQVSVSDLSTAEQEMLINNAPAYQVKEDLPLIDLVVESGLASSKREARTFIADGAITLRDEKVTDENMLVTLAEGEIVVMRRGKKQLAVLHK